MPQATDAGQHLPFDRHRVGQRIDDDFPFAKDSGTHFVFLRPMFVAAQLFKADVRKLAIEY